MKKMTLKLMAVICLATFGSMNLMAEAVQTDIQKLKVKKVLKGNVVVFEGKECKIAGVAITSPKEDALKFTRRSGLSTMSGSYAGIIGRDSQRVLAKILKEGEVYDVQPASSGSCVVYDKDGESVGDKMIAGGYAVPALKDIPAENRGHYEALLETAKKTEAGFWHRRGGTMYKGIMTFLVSENGVASN